MTDIIDIKAGKNHTVALKSTGEVYVTGSNLYGELGQNDTGLTKVKEFTKVKELKNIVQIGVGDSTVMALKDTGEVYTWGSNIYKELGIGSLGTYIDTPRKIEGLSDIRYLTGGKNYQAVINKDGEVFVCGQNSRGELGKGTNINVESFEKLDTINEVMDIDAGNTYTVFLKKDGTVWASGDYTHGDESIRVKTRGNVPVQVGDEFSGPSETEIVLEKGQSKDIIEDISYEFNLIYDSKDFADSLEYSSLKTDIASVSASGKVTGKNIGATRVNVVSSQSQKIYSVLIKVVPEGSKVSPKVTGRRKLWSSIKG